MTDRRKNTEHIDYLALLEEFNRSNSGPLQHLRRAFPALSLVGHLGEAIAKGLRDQGGLDETDRDNVIAIIREGRRNGVDEMSISMSREQWLGLKGRLSADDVDVGELNFGSGGSSEYRIDVSYK